MISASWRCIGLALLVWLPIAAPAAALEAADYQRVNDALVAHHVLPRYQRLAAAAAALNAAAARVCATPAATMQGEDLRQPFQAAMDAWMAVQHVRLGPIELFMRNYRLYFWPESRGKVDDAVRELLAARDPAMLAPEQMRKLSIAAQGLPAVEYLLYGQMTDPAGDAAAAGFRCRLVVALTGNVREMAEGVLADWQGGHIAFAKAVAEPGSGNPYFPTAKDATLAFFEGLHTELQVIADAKLKPPLGASLQAARPRLVESRLSGRSLRNIVIELEALQALYAGEGDGAGLGALVVAAGDTELDALMTKAFRITAATARGTASPLGEAVADPKQRPEVDKLLTQVLALKQIVRTRLAAALDLTVGFNALDGD